MPKRYKTVDGLFLSDFTKGFLKGPSAPGQVPFSELSRSITAHFCQPGYWTDFPEHADEEAQACFAELVRAGLVLLDQDDAGFLPKLSHPGQTFFDVPYRSLVDVVPGEVVFLGAPIDVGTTNFPGSRFGPQSLRQCSLERFRCMLNLETGLMAPVFLPALNRPAFAGARISDLGDLMYNPGQPLEDYYLSLRQVVQRIYSAGAFPLVIGGDHSISYATVGASSCDLVHFDAHSDLAPVVPGHSHHHGNFLTRLLSEGGVGDVFQYGLRDTSGTDTVVAGTHARGVFNLEQPDWHTELTNRCVFVSLDVDVLDPTVLPGTGTPSIGGLDLRRLCTCLAQVVQTCDVVGMDVVELCPMRDESGQSDRAVIEAIILTLALLHEKQQKAAPHESPV